MPRLTKRTAVVNGFAGQKPKKKARPPARPARRSAALYDMLDARARLALMFPGE
jgi:hypothetical protein